MSNELDLQRGPYSTTFVGLEMQRESTPTEWEQYGEVLRRVDEAKQWAIGDWLVDGKKHYGDKLYERAEALLDIPSNKLEQYATIARRFKNLRQRKFSLTYTHHYEVASLKTIAEDKDGKLHLSDETDYDKIDELLTKAEKEKLSVKALRDEVRKHKEEQQEYIRLANAPEKYSIIYADPPWKYTSGDQHTHEEQETVLGTHYPSMTITELCKLPVKQMAYENAVLFLWVTSPLLEEAFEIISAWGFNYKTSMVWDKVAHNVGNYVSVRHEFLLICAKGTPPSPTKLVDSVYSEDRSEHSRKPQYFRDLIDDIYPTGKRVELFARGELPEHWDSWGNEA